MFSQAKMGLVMSMRFIFGDDSNDVLFSSRVCSLAMDVISLESRRLILCIYTCVLNRFRNRSLNTIKKAKIPEEYLTVDKVRREKLLARKSCFM